MPIERQIYLLDPQKLDPETIAVAFAKTSRSPDSFRKIAAELTSEKSAEFHEKWVVGYGHASVAEHAVLHVAIENVSRLAVESIESNRLASYTEKSTRYQKWSSEAFFIPAEFRQEASPTLCQLYQKTCQALFDAYQQALPVIRADVEKDFPQKPGESTGAWERRIRSEYVDVCRFLLPSASLANLGMTINARELEHALRKMLSHPLDEVRKIGAEILAVAVESTPTLLKYVEPVPYLIETAQRLTTRVQQTFPVEKRTPIQDWCTLTDFDPNGENQVLAAALYRHGIQSYTQSMEYVCALSQQERAELAQALLGKLGRFDIPLRELEYAPFTFDVVLDQGAYFELKRHRMMTQTAQPLTPYLGYAVPRRFRTVNLEGLYRKAMDQAAEAYETLAAHNPEAAAYVIPNGFNRRVLLNFNLRSAAHFIALRAAPNAHFSMRRLALRIGETVQTKTPLLGQYLRIPTAETWQSIEQDYFASVC
jgi:thymidylate synthase ThyX